MMNSETSYSPLTLTMAVELAAPHTWPASIMPTLIAICAAAATTGGMLSVSTSLVLLLIVVLMQSAVNTFNDYYDYVKGLDSEEDNVDPTDAVLVYNNVNPHSALALAFGYLASAFVLGIYIIYLAGWIPLVIALIGAFFVVAYSAGSSPVSYLPIGEIVSGFVMGGLIPLACYQALTLRLNWFVLLWAIPTIIGVGLIMFTNNTCDIERDIPAGRKTASVLLGRNRARFLYHVLLIVMICDIVFNVLVFFTSGIIIAIFMLVASYPLVSALMKNPLEQKQRLQAMPQILSVNIVLGAFYAAAIVASGFVTLTF